MEPDVIRMYSSSPPPMDEGGEEDEDEFGDFGGFGAGLSSNLSFTEFNTPAGFGQSQATGTSPPDPFGSASNTAHRASLPGRIIRPSDKRQPDSAGSELTSGRAEARSRCVNGDLKAAEVLTNGFTVSASQNAPSGPAAAGNAAEPVQRRFADFSPFSEVERGGSSGRGADEGKRLTNGFGEQHADAELEGDGVEEAPPLPPTGARAPRAQAEGDGRFAMEQDSGRRDPEPPTAPRGPRPGPATQVPHAEAPEAVEKAAVGRGGWEERELTPGPSSQRGDAEEEQCLAREGEEATGPAGAVSEGFASSCEAASLRGPEDFGDFGGAGGFAPAPEGPLAKALSEAERHEGFGDFGDVDSLSSQGFADFSQTEDFADFITAPSAGSTDGGEFGDEDALRDCEEEDPEEAEEERSGGQPADFPGSDSFADFSCAPQGREGGMEEGAWAAFGGQEQGGAGGEAWAAFGDEPSAGQSEEGAKERWQERVNVTAPPCGSPQTSRRDSLLASLSGRLQCLFQATFPEAEAPEVGEEVPALKALLEPRETRQEQRDRHGAATQREPRDMWLHLQDIHDAFGLKYQWGGSHSNRVLLYCLGVDTRNILFTGQKKQPVIVPVFAASLGMLEPTKEAVKANSPAQAPPTSSESSTSSASTQQEALPSIQFDWNSSGLKNPLDAHGGPSRLNLDFFGPVEEDCSSGNAFPLPGVDPELYELTTAKLETSNTGGHIADAFTRLMSTMEKTSTSTRKPKRDEHLSEEAAKVISALPDLSFMQAKVLMFPCTLAPLAGSHPTLE